MATSSTSITEKEVRELYEGLTNEQLINILVAHWKTRKERDGQIPWKKNSPTIIIGT